MRTATRNGSNNFKKTGRISKNYWSAVGLNGPPCSWHVRDVPLPMLWGSRPQLHYRIFDFSVIVAPSTTNLPYPL
jgi:hypothetical protein